MAKNKRKHRSNGRRPAYSKEILGLAALMVAQKKLLPLKDDVSFKMFLSSPTAESNACLRFMLSAMTGREVIRARVMNSELVPDGVDEGLKKAANWCKFISGSTDPKVLETLGSDEDWKEEFKMAMDAYMKVSAEEKAWAYHLSTDRAEADYWNGLRQSREQGREDGLKEGIVTSLKNLIANTGMTQSQAMDALGIQGTDRDSYVAMLSS